MPRGSDGGKWALAGFLYQMLGMASITARALPSPVISDGDDSNEVDALIALIGDGEGVQALHEELDQDVVFTQNDRCVIAQFKYSSTPGKIYPSELGTIIAKLDKSAGLAISEGEDVTACVLVTNREFSRTTEERWKTERSGARNYELRRCSVPQEDFERGLRDFGAAYGLFAQEVEAGINKLIGKVFRQTTETLGASVGKEDIVQSFVGYAHARPLTIAKVGPLCDQQLGKFGMSIRVDHWDNEPVRRTILEDIVQAMHERALVGIHGEGGCGKSVILWQLLRRCQDEGARTRFFVVSPARDVLDSWITDTVHKWRNLRQGRRPDDNREQAIERLQIANPSSPKPIIWLALDGLDEGPMLVEQRIRIQSLVHWFWTKDHECRESGQRPSATLVVSCRRKEDLKEEWLRLQPDDSDEYAFAIGVGDFSAREIELAAERSFPELHRRLASLQRSRLGFLETDYSSIPYTDASPFPQSGSVDETVFGALKHPIMWRALLGLEETVRLSAIEGDRQALHCLARGFMELFHSKLKLRHDAFHDWDVDRLIEILRLIATHTSGPAAYARDGDWTEPACDDRRFSVGEAVALYSEALSAGVITEEAPLSWRWRHMIIREYLASEAGSG